MNEEEFEKQLMRLTKNLFDISEIFKHQQNIIEQLKKKNKNLRSP